VTPFFLFGALPVSILASNSALSAVLVSYLISGVKISSFPDFSSSNAWLKSNN
jgi:hypothetical protein